MRNLILIVLIMAFVSCSNDDFTDSGLENTGSVETRDDGSRMIVMPDAEVSFIGMCDTVDISVEPAGWWIDKVVVDGNVTETAEADKAVMAGGGSYAAKYGWLSLKTHDGGLQLIAEENDGESRNFEVWLASETDTVAIKGMQEAMPPVGIWPDVIGLSTKELFMKGLRDTVRIETENTGWWINEITLDDGTVYRPVLAETEMMLAGKAVNIRCGWLAVECGERMLTISVDDNYEEARHFEIKLQSGDYFDKIKGTQDDFLTGIWPDMIGLSQDSLSFDAGGGTVACTTSPKGQWWVQQIDIDGNMHVMELEERETCSQKGRFEKLVGWITVKRDGDMVYITAQPNDTGRERSFHVVLQSGDWFSHLYGTQAGY